MLVVELPLLLLLLLYYDKSNTKIKYEKVNWSNISSRLNALLVTVCAVGFCGVHVGPISRTYLNEQAELCIRKLAFLKQISIFHHHCFQD